MSSRAPSGRGGESARAKARSRGEKLDGSDCCCLLACSERQARPPWIYLVVPTNHLLPPCRLPLSAERSPRRLACQLIMMINGGANHHHTAGKCFKSSSSPELCRQAAARSRVTAQLAKTSSSRFQFATIKSFSPLCLNSIVVVLFKSLTDPRSWLTARKGRPLHIVVQLHDKCRVKEKKWFQLKT